MQGGVGLVGRLFVHMYPVWLYEESLVTISIEFTVILYVRMRVSEYVSLTLSDRVSAIALYWLLGVGTVSPSSPLLMVVTVVIPSVFGGTVQTKGGGTRHTRQKKLWRPVGVELEAVGRRLDLEVERVVESE